MNAGKRGRALLRRLESLYEAGLEPAMASAHETTTQPPCSGTIGRTIPLM